jgi:hypothetical protein
MPYVQASGFILNLFNSDLSTVHVIWCWWDVETAMKDGTGVVRNEAVIPEFTWSD